MIHKQARVRASTDSIHKYRCRPGQLGKATRDTERLELGHRLQVVPHMLVGESSMLGQRRPAMDHHRCDLQGMPEVQGQHHTMAPLECKHQQERRLATKANRLVD